LADDDTLDEEAVEAVAVDWVKTDHLFLTGCSWRKGLERAWSKGESGSSIIVAERMRTESVKAVRRKELARRVSEVKSWQVTVRFFDVRGTGVTSKSKDTTITPMAKISNSVIADGGGLVLL
jgi:hypothetical protein